MRALEREQKTSYVLLDVQQAVATIRLNRPDMLNALNEPMLLELTAAFRRLTGDEIRAVVLCANGPAFCAGAEIAESAEGGADLGELLRRLYHPLITEMRALQKPIIVAVNGMAAGAGMSIALAGDVIVGSENAAFCAAFLKIGLVPDAGCTFFLPRTVGEHRARALAMLADRIDAHDAERYGILYRIVPSERLLMEAHALAARLARMPTTALGLTKRALGANAHCTLGAQLELEAQLQSSAGRTEDFREGVAAFLAKRAGVFSGR